MFDLHDFASNGTLNLLFFFMMYITWTSKFCEVLSVRVQVVFTT